MSALWRTQPVVLSDNGSDDGLGLPEDPVLAVPLHGLTVDEGRVCVSLTFTAMGCPASDMIMGDIRDRLLAEPGIEDVRLDVVWDPPWTSARLSDDGREALRAWGLSV